MNNTKKWDVNNFKLLMTILNKYLMYVTLIVSFHAHK